MVTHRRQFKKSLDFFEHFSISMIIETVPYLVPWGRYVYSTPSKHGSLALSERHIPIVTHCYKHSAPTGLKRLGAITFSINIPSLRD